MDAPELERRAEEGKEEGKGEGEAEAEAEAEEAEAAGEAGDHEEEESVSMNAPFTAQPAVFPPLHAMKYEIKESNISL